MFRREPLLDTLLHSNDITEEHVTYLYHLNDEICRRHYIISDCPHETNPNCFIGLGEKKESYRDDTSKEVEARIGPDPSELMKEDPNDFVGLAVRSC